jgi:hypothetical protein
MKTFDMIDVFFTNFKDPQNPLVHIFSKLGVKKNTCGSGSRPTLFFSADPIIFFNAIDK